MSATTQVLFVDTMGELLMLYAAADVAFVGGSLVPVGGHSLLEPSALQCPIVTGPYNFNAPDVAAQLHDAVVTVSTPEDLGRVVLDLLRDSLRRDRMIAAANQVLASNRGALAKILARIAELIR